MSLNLALFGHGAMSDLSPLSGVKRKLDFGAVRAAFDPRTDIVRMSSAQIVRRWQWAPEMGRNLAVLVVWSLGCVVVPRARIEIAEFLVLHLIELDVELDELIVGTTVIDRDVVARPVTYRPPVDRHLAQREQFAGVLDVGEVLHLEGDMMHFGLGAADEINRVVIRVAAQEDKVVLDPVRHPETQYVAVEFGHCLRILHEVGDVTELKWAGAEYLVVGAEVLPFVEELNRGAFGIVEGQHLADARNDIAAHLALHTVGR